MNRLVVINVVGLTRGLIGDQTPNIKAFAEAGQLSSFAPEFPAVTCSAQSSYLTGQRVEGHGIVGNGWYDRESGEVRFWKQSNHLVHQYTILLIHLSSHLVIAFLPNHHE